MEHGEDRRLRFSSFFGQFGPIDNHVFFAKTRDRRSAAAILTYHSAVDIDRIIRENQHLRFDHFTLVLRRTLPAHRPAFEQFMTSNELLLSLPLSTYEAEFNENSIREYFRQYGLIISFRVLIPHRTYLINFADTSSVDKTIIAEPHLFNHRPVLVRKYVSPDWIHHATLKNQAMQLQCAPVEKIRRLKHIIEALQFGYKVQWILIRRSYLEKILRLHRERGEKPSFDTWNTRCEGIEDEIQQWKEKNQCLNGSLQQSHRLGTDLIERYQKNIDKEQKRAQQLKEAIDFLKYIEN